MSLAKNYFSIPLLTLAVAAAGSWLTQRGLGWYATLRLPALAPGGSTIALVWTIIYLLATLAALRFYNAPRRWTFSVILVLFLLSALFNVFWSLLFFTLHRFLAALVEMIILDFFNLALIFLLARYEKGSALLLLPYFFWVAYAAYLTYLIAALNGWGN